MNVQFHIGHLGPFSHFQFKLKLKFCDKVECVELFFPKSVISERGLEGRRAVGWFGAGGKGPLNQEKWVR